MTLPTVVEFINFVVTLVGFLFSLLAASLALVHLKSLEYRDNAGKFIFPRTPPPRTGGSSTLLAGPLEKILSSGATDCYSPKPEPGPLNPALTSA
ncbi:hypothetical protein BP6252_12770 [Coleophoma cylindrospora]|uniref:Uncharacterized protein n=1 Tax=Coleophoma cylindrospora TaxID=1849047 RepID=A0A3D8QCW0_9HELO|nr:hypothetical protein BP6252_12770 [Coleophoma cylindrospora]